MNKVEQLETEVQALTASELTQFRDWFLDFDWQLWDAQLERDAAEGRLDALAERALAAHAARKTSLL